MYIYSLTFQKCFTEHIHFKLYSVFIILKIKSLLIGINLLAKIGGKQVVNLLVNLEKVEVRNFV